LIGALNNHFCENCNRLRLTADGHLRRCLFSEEETDLKTPLRHAKDDAYLLNLIGQTISNKPEKHGLTMTNLRKCARSMNSIGG
jgi:GTP 3',8-cyclase